MSSGTSTPGGGNGHSGKASGSGTPVPPGSTGTHSGKGKEISPFAPGSGTGGTLEFLQHDNRPATPPQGSRSGTPAKTQGHTPKAGSPAPVPGASVPHAPQAAGTLLGLARVKDKPLLVRTKDGKEVDFWNQITKLTPANLEVVLNLAKLDVEYDMNAFIQGITYQGFDRLFYIKHALTKISVKHFSQFAVLGAIRGSNLTKIVEKSEHVPQDLLSAFSTAGFVKTPKKRVDLTILRCTASIPHWCAFWMQKAHVPKKMVSESCPAALQFPGAASLPMSKSVRLAHIKFCQTFSNVLPGGVFNANIYLTAFNNMIPVSDVPAEILAILGVSSDDEARAITSEELQDSMSKAVVKAKA